MAAIRDLDDEGDEFCDRHGAFQVHESFECRQGEGLCGIDNPAPPSVPAGGGGKSASAAESCWTRWRRELRRKCGRPSHELTEGERLNQIFDFAGAEVSVQKVEGGPVSESGIGFRQPLGNGLV